MLYICSTYIPDQDMVQSMILAAPPPIAKSSQQKCTITGRRRDMERDNGEIIDFNR